MSNKPKAYFGWKRAKSGRPVAYCQMATIEKVEKWLCDDEEKEEESKEQDVIEKEEINNFEPLRKSMSDSIKMTHAQGEMVNLIRYIKPAILSAIIDEEMIGLIKSRGKLVDGARGEIYELEIDKMDGLSQSKSKIDRMELGFSVLNQSIFLGIIANFDSSISDSIKIMLKMGPEKLISGNNTVKISEISKMSSISDVIDHAIEREVYELLRGSQQDQIKYVEDNFNISIKDKWKRYSDFIEVFERRNLIAHGEGYFTKLYLQKCREAGCEIDDSIIGSGISIEKGYVHKSLDLMLEFNVLMLFQFWRKKFPRDANDAFKNINNVIYSLIIDRRFVAAINIGEFAKSINSTNVDESVRRMIVINIASAYRHRNDNKSCNKILSEYDWSACSDNYKICVEALNGNVEKVTEIMGRLGIGGEIKKEEFRKWPVFDFVKSNEIFIKKFEEIFGEKYKKEYTKEVISSLDSKEISSNIEIKKNNNSVH